MNFLNRKMLYQIYDQYKSKTEKLYPKSEIPNIIIPEKVEEIGEEEENEEEMNIEKTNKKRKKVQFNDEVLDENKKPYKKVKVRYPNPKKEKAKMVMIKPKRRPKKKMGRI